VFALDLVKEYSNPALSIKYMIVFINLTLFICLESDLMVLRSLRLPFILFYFPLLFLVEAYCPSCQVKISGYLGLLLHIWSCRQFLSLFDFNSF